MSVSDFEQRRKRILELIIEAYVASAAPVGSEYVSKKLRSSLSPATIRNIMVDLEEAGLLEQPHTSAGRVPTDRGYRYYVDAVMDVHHLPQEELRQMAALIEPPELDVEELLERSGEALSQLTQQAAFVVAPTVKQSTMKQVELVPLGVRKILCVMVANEEIVSSSVVEVTEPMTRDEAAALARFMTTELAGLPFGGLLESLERRMLAQSDSFYHLVKRSLDILQHALSTEPEERLLLEGASYVIAQPEFLRDPRKAQELLRGLDAEDVLLQRLRQDAGGEGVRVRIGREVQVPGLDECSYLTASFAIHDEAIGGLGVLGPRRMDYRRMRALVEGMSRCVTDVLSRWERESS
ncbi:MAG: heat-inducible transcription repressor HrcA [Candidatus Omnitrophica bacterium]|nr:heat-inducible transcription repressor HrcA [Candidatus Omnitrophota bacterium]